MKTVVNVDIPQKHNDYKPDSITLDNDRNEGEWVDVTVYSEEDKKETTISMTVRDLYFAVKGFYDQAQDWLQRDKLME